jgi:hypothetical protein
MRWTEAESIREEHRVDERPRMTWPARTTGRRAIVLLGATLALVAFAGGGCGGSDRSLESTARYEPPNEHPVVVETVVDLPFEEAWDELIRRLSEGSFQISALEKVSRFVAVDLHRSSDLAAASDQPARYVDCGRTLRTFSREGEIERLDYAVADSSQHREVDLIDGAFRVSEVLRRVGFQARVNIYLQPEGLQRTRISLNTRYTLEIEVSGTAQFVPMDDELASGPPLSFGPRRESIRFTTFQPGRDARSGELVCRATGALEHSLIALANPAAAI